MDHGLKALGVPALVELIAGAGFYAMLAMSLSAFDAAAPGQQRT